MKKKFFLRGLGLGIFVTALILGLSYRDKLSNESVISRAKKLGMTFASSENPDSTEKPDESAEPDTSAEPEITIAPDISTAPEVTAAPDNSASPEMSSLPEVSSKPEVSLAPESSKLPASDDSKDISTEKEGITNIVFKIERGAWSKKVSQDLESLGIIDDSEAFDKYLVDNDYAQKIKVGSFKLTPGISYEELANMITE